ncbi:UNVERIFIED_CONTAM: hypothetical protein FKN15_017952 [Acipenser sinensis]
MEAQVNVRGDVAVSGVVDGNDDVAVTPVVGVGSGVSGDVAVIPEVGEGSGVSGDVAVVPVVGEGKEVGAVVVDLREDLLVSPSSSTNICDLSDISEEEEEEEDEGEIVEETERSEMEVSQNLRKEKRKMVEGEKGRKTKRVAIADYPQDPDVGEHCFSPQSSESGESYVPATIEGEGRSFLGDDAVTQLAEVSRGEEPEHEQQERGNQRGVLGDASEVEERAENEVENKETPSGSGSGPELSSEPDQEEAQQADQEVGREEMVEITEDSTKLNQETDQEDGWMDVDKRSTKRKKEEGNESKVPDKVLSKGKKKAKEEVRIENKNRYEGLKNLPDSDVELKTISTESGSELGSEVGSMLLSPGSPLRVDFELQSKLLNIEEFLDQNQLQRFNETTLVLPGLSAIQEEGAREMQGGGGSTVLIEDLAVSQSEEDDEGMSEPEEGGSGVRIEVKGEEEATQDSLESLGSLPCGQDKVVSQSVSVESQEGSEMEDEDGESDSKLDKIGGKRKSGEEWLVQRSRKEKRKARLRGSSPGSTTSLESERDFGALGAVSPSPELLDWDKEKVDQLVTGFSVGKVVPD